MPIAGQLIEKTNYFSELGAPAIGPSGANWSEALQICHADFRPANRMSPESVGRTPKEKPGAFAPGGGTQMPTQFRAVKLA
jgi:hypothetical protein